MKNTDFLGKELLVIPIYSRRVFMKNYNYRSYNIDNKTYDISKELCLMLDWSHYEAH